MEDPAYIPGFRTFLAEQDVEEKRRVLNEKINRANALTAQIPSFSQFQPEPTAAHEAVMRDVPGTDQATAGKFLKSDAARGVTHLPPAIPTRSNQLIDQQAAKFEVLKNSGGWAKLTPEERANVTAPLTAAGWKYGEDESGNPYIQPPATRSDLYGPSPWPLWERQLAGPSAQPQAKSVMEQLKETAAGVVGFAKSAGEIGVASLAGKPMAAGKKLKEVVVDPQIEQIRIADQVAKQNGFKDVWGALIESIKAPSSPRAAEVLGHLLAGAIPFAGPQAAAGAEQLGKGEVVSGGINVALALAPSVLKAVKGARGKVGGAEGMRHLDELIKEVDQNARETPQIQREAGPAGEAYRGVGAEGRNVAAEGEVGRLRNHPKAEVAAQGEVAPQSASRSGVPIEIIDRPADPRMSAGQAQYIDRGGVPRIRFYRDTWDKLTPKGRQFILDHEDGHHIWAGLDADTHELVKEIWDELPDRSKDQIRNNWQMTDEDGGAVEEFFAEQRAAYLAYGKDVETTPRLEQLFESRPELIEEAPRAQEPIPINAGREGAARIEETAGQIPEATRQAEARTEAAAPQVGERSLPKTLEQAGLAKGTDLTYDVAANPATVEKARQNIAEKGIEGATEYVRSAETPSAEHTATGFAVIRELQDAGKFDQAAEVASDLSANLTASGQAIQAVKTIAEFAPERAVVTAQKVLDKTGKGKKLSPIQAERITKAATAIEDTGKTVAKTEARLDAVAAKLPKTSPANWRAKLLSAEEAARARMAERQGKALGPEAGEAPIIADLADLAIVGAAKLARKGIDFGTWSKEMLSEFGDSIKPHLARIYRASFEQYSGAKREAYQAMKERAVQKGLPAMTAQELATAVKQRDLAVKQRTAATRGLASEYERLQPGARVKREILSVLNLPRALKASFDLSAPLRQGAVFLPEVKASGKAFGAQIRALNERGFEKVYADIQRNPEFQTGQTSGLELTGSPLRAGSKLNAAEEAFMTRWAEKIPGVKQSEQAYSAYLDTLRMNVFEKYAKQIKSQITDPKLQAAELKHWADFVNKATGRGNLGRAGNAIAPVLNSAFFSPRYAVSRLQILNPATYMKMTPFARKTALRKMFQFTGLVGTTLALAKASGLEVSTDPQSADFLKIKSGNTRFDILAGTQQWMRLAARLSAGFYKSSQGEKMKPGEQPLEVLTRFARSKASPPAGIVWDYATGRTFEGEQPTLKGELQDQFIPLFLDDAYKTWKDTNTPTGAKAAATVGGFFGVGTQTYAPRTKKPAVKTPAQKQKELRRMLGLE